MALLGTFFDVIRLRSLVGDAGGAVIVSGYVHSLGTTPDVVIPVVRSIERLASAPYTQLFSEIGNASQATVGVLSTSNMLSASRGTIAFDIYVQYVHSIAR